MLVPATNDDLLDLVRKSGVLEESRLTAWLDKLKADPAKIPEQPAKFAARLVRDGLLTHFQAQQILQGKYKRFNIGKYKVLEKIGTGGMGQVYLCEHKAMRRRVAVKVLPVAQAADAAARDRFHREACAAAALDHPNIVRAFDVDQDDNLHFLVMEYVDGTNLNDLVKKHGPLGVARACHYINAAAAGLQYANGMGIVHRDIKPGNLIVDRAGVVKVLDMGLARFFKDEDDHLSRQYDEKVLGTADYLAPEQAVDSHLVDIRADIYSLGGTFYFLLTGQPPFPQGNIAQKLAQHQQREPKPIRDIRPDVPEEIAAIVAKMMKKNPDERHATPADVMADLQEYVQAPIAPPAEAEMPRLSRAAMGGASSTVGRAPASGALLTGGSGSGSGPIAVVAEHNPTDVWAEIASDTSPRLAGDTPPIVKRSHSSIKIEPQGPRPGRRKKLLLAAAAAVILIAVAVFVVLKLTKRI